MDGFYEKVQQSAEYILSHSTLRPTCGMSWAAAWAAWWTK